MEARLEPEELLLAALLRRAIKDAQDGKSTSQTEARWWLWTFAPTIAEHAKVAPVEIATDNAVSFR